MNRSATEKQKAASRLNGSKSHGPVTADGKRRSSRNSLRHGLLARTVVLDGESRERFNELSNALTAELCPQTTIQTLLVQKMAVAHWRQMRLWNLEKANIALAVSAQPSETGPNGASDDPSIRGAKAFRDLSDNSRSQSLISQYESRCDRQFTRALELFEKIARKDSASNPAT